MSLVTFQSIESMRNWSVIIFRSCVHVFSSNLTSLYVFQDDRYKKYVGKMAIVPLSGGREIPIIADEVCNQELTLCGD